MTNLLQPPHTWSNHTYSWWSCCAHLCHSLREWQVFSTHRIVVCATQLKALSLFLLTCGKDTYLHLPCAQVCLEIGEQCLFRLTQKLETVENQSGAWDCHSTLQLYLNWVQPVSRPWQMVTFLILVWRPLPYALNLFFLTRSSSIVDQAGLISAN